MKPNPTPSYHVLCVCTGNICRSPMAEGLLAKMLSGRMPPGARVRSAGTHANPGQAAEPFAVEAARERDVDISTHRATLLTPDLLRCCDLILVMEKMHLHYIEQMMPTPNSRVHLLGAYHPSAKVLEIPDPYGGRLEDYRFSWQLIEACLREVPGLLETIPEDDPSFR